MDGGFTSSVEETLCCFSLLAQATENIYFIYDYENDRLYFSENIQKAGDLFPFGQKYCKLEEWQNRMETCDAAHLTQLISDLVSHKSERIEFNYRLCNAQNEYVWINTRGKGCYRTDRSLCCIIGQLSVSRDERQQETYNHKELKCEIREILKNVNPCYLLLIGVDNLKAINLTNGRDFGDTVLNDIARIIGEETGQRFRVYRINGDWFAVNLQNTSEEEVRDIFRRVQQRMASQCTLSAGCVSYIDYHVTDESILLQYAESALDCSKSQGKDRLTFFTPENYEKKLRELELHAEMRESIESNYDGFELYYQPQFYTENYELFGAEALLRYRSRRYGNIGPSEFIPILEQSGLIYPVGLWVLKQALSACREWRAKFPDFHISVNMSYRQLEYSSIEGDVLQMVLSSGLPGNALTIEVTESMELSNYSQLNSCFRRWKKIGIELSVDDFGTGYSSLGRLKKLAVDEIKVDRCFVREIQDSAYNYRLLKNMIDWAGSSQIRVCCEGVETEEEVQVLRELSPTVLQGFYFARPVSYPVFEAQYIDFAIGEHLRKKEEENSGKNQKLVESKAALEELTQTILNAENDIFYLSDMDNYSLYYLNPAGQKMFGAKDYYGKKCYRVLHGKNEPCSFCTNHLLRRESFYVWENRNEYCGRHFLLKDKLVQYMGKNVRLEVALDITKKEYLSQSAQERLSFAEKILGYLKVLSECPDYEKAVNKVLSSVGDFYQADRAYLFEHSREHPGHWNNTFEWCAVNVQPQKDNLQNVPPQVVNRWMEIFDREQSIIILNIAPLRVQSPDEWRVLNQQGIQRVIVVPLRENGKTIGFIGVDNPRYCIQDDVQVRTLASFLLARIRQDRNEHRYQALLQQSREELLSILHVGFWTLRFPKDGSSGQMLCDRTMYQLMGLSESTDPVDCYQICYSGIRADMVEAVRQAFAKMSATDQAVQVIFPWNHPKKGEVEMRLTGILSEETPEYTQYKGYCREHDDSFLRA